MKLVEIILSQVSDYFLLVHKKLWILGLTLWMKSSVNI